MTSQLHDTIHSTIHKILDLYKPTTDYVYIKLHITQGTDIAITDISKPELRPIHKLSIPSTCIDTHIPYIPSLSTHNDHQAYITEYHLLLEVRHHSLPLDVESLCIKSDQIPFANALATETYTQIARTIKYTQL
jgi:hypothetical protein